MCLSASHASFCCLGTKVAQHLLEIAHIIAFVEISFRGGGRGVVPLFLFFLQGFSFFHLFTLFSAPHPSQDTDVPLNII